MSINLCDLLAQVTPYLKEELRENQELQKLVLDTCFQEYRTQEAAFVALNHLGYELCKIFPSLSDSKIYQAVDKKAELFMTEIKSRIFNTPMDGISRKRPASPVSSEISESPRKVRKVEEEVSFLDFPPEVFEEIFSELGSQSYKSLACRKMMLIHAGLRLRQAQLLQRLDASSQYLSNVGIEFPKEFTAETGSRLFKKLYQTLTILSIAVLGDLNPNKMVRDCVLDPILLKRFFERVGDIGQSAGLRGLAGVRLSASNEESRDALREWLRTSDLDEVIARCKNVDAKTLADWNSTYETLSAARRVQNHREQEAAQQIGDPEQDVRYLSYNLISSALAHRFPPH